MKNIIIVGTGAVAAEITSFLTDSSHALANPFKIKGYLEFGCNLEKYYQYYGLEAPVLGDIDSYQIQNDDYFVVGIADIQFRKKMIDELERKGAQFVNIIHPTAIIASSAEIGIGNIINPFSIVGPKAKIGNYNLLTSYSAISHDCRVGDNNVFSSTILCGHVTVGHDNSFGIKASVIPHVKIGNHTIIQAGMTVDKEVPDHATVFHRFKEKVLAIPKTEE